MNYFEFMKVLRHISLQHPFVNNYYEDKYKLNHVNDIEYAAVVVTTNRVNVGPQVTVFSLNLMYVDRHTEENDNTNAVRSLGISVLTEIVNAIRYCYKVSIGDALSFMPFKDQFVDRCVGVYCTIELTIPSEMGECHWLTNLKYDCC